MESETKRTNKVGFSFEENDNPFGHSVKMVFDVEPDASINVLHDLCKRFMLAIGYGESTVEEVFGETDYDFFN